MRLRRLCLEIFALRRFFKEPIAGVSVCRASEAQPKHRLSEIANAFGAKSRELPLNRSFACSARPPCRANAFVVPSRLFVVARVSAADGYCGEDTALYSGCSCRLPARERFRSPQRQNLSNVARALRGAPKHLA